MKLKCVEPEKMERFVKKVDGFLMRECNDTRETTRKFKKGGKVT